MSDTLQNDATPDAPAEVVAERPNPRLAHIQALRAERASLNSRPDGPTKDRRVAEIEAQLDSFGEAPAVQHIETATPGPISTARTRAARKPRA